jgi:predicted CopG family antitoxin
MRKSSTIRLSVETKKELNKFGAFGESYEDIIRRLIKRCKETENRGREHDR